MKITMRRSSSVLALALAGCAMSPMVDTSPRIDSVVDARGRETVADTPNNWAIWKDATDRQIQDEVTHDRPPGIPTWQAHWVDVIDNTSEWVNPQKYFDYVIGTRRRAGLPELDLTILRVNGINAYDMRKRYGIGGVVFESASPSGCVYRATSEPSLHNALGVVAVITDNHGSCERYFHGPYIALDTLDPTATRRIASMLFGERRRAFIDALLAKGTVQVAEAIEAGALEGGVVINAQGNTPKWVTRKNGDSYEIEFTDLENLKFIASSWQ